MSPPDPCSGWLYAAPFSLLGESTLAWQLYALLWRWLSVLALWWLLRLLWPTRRRLATVAALIFAIYPGFSQQPIAVTYSLYWLYFTLFLFSLCCTVLSLRPGGRSWAYAAGALLLAGLYHVLHRILLRPGTGPRPVEIRSCSTAKHRLGA